MSDFSELLGQTLTNVVVSEDNYTVRFETEEGKKYVMLHHQDCCESVYLEDVCGDWQDLLGYELLVASERSSDEEDEDVKAKRLHAGEGRCPDSSETWTYYKLDTIKGGVTLRWYGTSNGYYSESVAFEEVAQ